jgi:ribonuclease J
MLIEAEGEAIKDRRRLAAEGAVNVAIAINGKGALAAGPNVSIRGLSVGDEEALEAALADMEDAAEAAFERLARGDREVDDVVQAALVRAVRKAAERLWSKRPLVDVTVLRI